MRFKIYRTRKLIAREHYYMNGESKKEIMKSINKGWKVKEVKK
jgi:hypothetical protein